MARKEQLESERNRLRRSLGAGPWIATFNDGPLADNRHDRLFAVGPVYEDLYLMPAEPGTALGRAGQYAVVGYSGLEPEQPWPGQVHYRFEDAVEMMGVDGEPVCYYAWVKE